MRVADVMSYRPQVVDAFETIESAAQRMRAQVVGALPVVEHGRLVGIVTDRDLALRGVAAGARPWETYVREVMTESPATCLAADSIDDAVERMLTQGVRRLIVVDDAGAVLGMLSVDDLALHDETQPLALKILQELVGVRGAIDGTFAQAPL